MNKNDEMTKVEAALKRAGQTALRGPRDARNGKFTAVEATKKPPSSARNNDAKKEK